MSTRIKQIMAGLVGIGALIGTLLMGTGLANASTALVPNVTGANVTSLGQTGYSATNGQFQVVQGTVYLRAPGQYSPIPGVVGGSVSLWASNGTVVQLGISATVNPVSGYSVGIAPFDSSHNQLSTGITRQGVNAFPAGESVHFRMAYDRNSGLVNMSVADATHTFRATYDAGTGLSYNQARVTSDFGNTPWDSSGWTGAAPTATMRYLSWSAASLTNYKGKTSTFWGYFTHHKLILVGAPGHATPSNLNGGASFSTSLQP